MNVTGAVIAGLVGTIVMTMLMYVAPAMRMHPRPPKVAAGPKTMAGQLMGHMVYAW